MSNPLLIAGISVFTKSLGYLDLKATQEATKAQQARCKGSSLWGRKGPVSLNMNFKRRTKPNKAGEWKTK